jgi:hypothetical protein
MPRRNVVYNRDVLPCATSDCQKTLSRGTAKYRVTPAHVRHARGFKLVLAERALICSDCRVRFKRNYISPEAAAAHSAEWRDLLREAAPALLIAAAASAAGRPSRSFVAGGGTINFNATVRVSDTDPASSAASCDSPTAASTGSVSSSDAICAQESADTGISSGDAVASANEAAAESSEHAWSGHILAQLLVAHAVDYERVTDGLGQFGRNPIEDVDFNVCRNHDGDLCREWFAEPFFKMRAGDRMRASDTYHFILVGAPHLLEACVDRTAMYQILSTGALYLVVARHFLQHLSLMARHSPIFKTARVEVKEWLCAFEPRSSGVDSIMHDIFPYEAPFDGDQDDWKISVSRHIAFL